MASNDRMVDPNMASSDESSGDNKPVNTDAMRLAGKKFMANNSK